MNIYVSGKLRKAYSGSSYTEPPMYRVYNPAATPGSWLCLPREATFANYIKAV